MPVFFYIDPDFLDDANLEITDNIMLSYTFFESKQGLVLPQPLTPQAPAPMPESIVRANK